MNKKLLTASSLLLLLSACDDDYSPSKANDVGQVTVAGEALVGETLTATVTDDNGLSTSTITYSWLAGGTPISGASGSSYVIADTDLGTQIIVAVNYVDDDDFESTIRSEATDEIEAPAVNTPGTLTIDGTPTVGFTLTAVIDDANGVDGEITYAWMADATAIDGATESTYLLTDNELTKVITVTAMYADNDGFEEDLASAATAAVEAPAPDAPNVDGSVSISAPNGLVLGEELTAVIVDPNGVGTATVQWSADGVDISGAEALTFTPMAADLGKVLSVHATYTDNDGYDEDVMADATDMVYSYIVSNEDELVAAAAAAVDGDYIGLDTAVGGDYEEMAEIVFVAPNLTLTRTLDSTAVISGATCLVINGDGSTVDGLQFEDVDFIAGGDCDSSGNATLLLDAVGVTLMNSTFSGEVGSSTEYNMVAVKGADNVIERNLFEGNRTSRDKSGAISIFSDPAEGDKENTTVQYNLFKNMTTTDDDSSLRASGAYAIQVGRSTGSDSTGTGNHKIQYNRFDKVLVDERLIKFQTSNSSATGNTIVNSTGMINLEDGSGNTVTNNVFIASGDQSDDGGVGFSPMGHTVTNNYMENIRTTSGDRSPLFLHNDMVPNGGNQDIIDAGVVDLTVVVANNTVVNSQQGLSYDDKDCTSSDAPGAIVDFDSNLIVNESTDGNGNSSIAVRDKDFNEEPCTLDPATDFDNNHFYAVDLSDSGTFDFSGKAADNVSGGVDGGDFTRDSAGLAVGQNTDANVGADTTLLRIIEESEVGPGSTWTID